MTRVWSMPIDLDDPEDRRVATWLAAQPNPAIAVKKLILDASSGNESPARLLELVPSILHEVRALRTELDQARADEASPPWHEEVLYELRALRADLARAGPKELGRVSPPPEDPESAQRLDALFNQ
jgi:hypothetical protein